jgi:spermidine/putrescine transport system substrate-binding protein
MYARLLEQGVPVALGKPKEGVRTWVCGLTMHPETKNPDAAYDFINSFTSPEAGQFMLEVFGIGHCNKIAFDNASPEILEMFALSDPESFLKNGIFYETMTPENEARYNEIYESAKVGI